MEIARLDPHTIIIRDIDPFAASLLRRIPFESDPGDDPAARQRLFSGPVGEGIGEDEARHFNEEWRQYVEPELRHLFQSANDTVVEDLKKIHLLDDGADGEVYSLQIPVNHIDQWLNSLNQARLVMAARNGFTEEELADKYPTLINSTRDLNLLQINFYAFIQGILIQEIDREAGEG